VMALAASALVVTLMVVPHLGTEFLPELNEGSLWVNLTMPPSVSLSEASRLMHLVRDLLRSVPEVGTVVAKAGSPEDGTDPKPLNMSEIYVEVKPEAQWTAGRTRDDVLDDIRRKLEVVPGIETSLSQPIRDNVLEAISQVDGQIVIKVFGVDPATLRQTAGRVLQAVSRVRGVDRAFVDRAGEIPQFQIAIDRDRAARYGLNVADVQDVIEVALGGAVATQLWEGEKRFGVVVRLRNEERRDLSDIRNLLVDSPEGPRVPLEQVAALSVRGGEMNISREAGSRLAAISVFIRGRDMGSVVRDMQQQVAREVRLPTGYYLTWGGEFENQQRAMARLAIIVPISLLLIFVLLFNAFQSIRTALVILGTIPMAAIGGIVALAVTRIPLSVSAAIGFIALFGQAVLNGVVMVADIRQRSGDGQPVRPAIEAGAVVRLRTVLMTALLAMLGLLPMALSHEIGSEVQRPLAVVVIGGLLTATALTLFVLPALYELVEGRSAVKQRPEGGEVKSP
jgi:cobalt-zinc-cadmium resistance protein CzcA